MTGFEIRPPAAGEERAAFELLGRALHTTVTDELWARRAASFPAERRFGAFAGGEPVGVAGSFATRLAVPGGKAVSVAAPSTAASATASPAAAGPCASPARGSAPTPLPAVTCGCSAPPRRRNWFPGCTRRWGCPGRA
ncbi:GNAT family N-acetyltransferase [Amycolatopsis thermalba]|uniref:GNAT family N-acetyltransferase n=1 Tax=Amycolatopsis thermalba TaxID=944492 RepID=UPI003B8486C3